MSLRLLPVLPRIEEETELSPLQSLDGGTPFTRGQIDVGLGRCRLSRRHAVYAHALFGSEEEFPAVASELGCPRDYRSVREEAWGLYVPARAFSVDNGSMREAAVTYAGGL